MINVNFNLPYFQTLVSVSRLLSGIQNCDISAKPEQLQIEIARLDMTFEDGLNVLNVSKWICSS